MSDDTHLDRQWPDAPPAVPLWEPATTVAEPPKPKAVPATSRESPALPLRTVQAPVAGVVNPLQASADSESKSLCTLLPAGVLPQVSVRAGKWIDLYMNYAQAVLPMTPVLFHESAALWLGSVAIARRLKVAMPFGDIYPNLFIAWLAPTTLFRKSTALSIARGLAQRAFPHLLAQQDTTPEAFLSDMAGKEPPNLADLTAKDQELWRAERDFSAQRAWILDELSGLMSGAGRDYNAGLVETIIRFYDCDPLFSRSTRGQGRIVVKNAYLTILGASTPAAMSAYMMPERLWTMGFWPRFALLTPESDRPEWKRARKVDNPTELFQVLHGLYAKLPQATWPESPTALSVSLESGVLEAWERYTRALSYDLLTPELDGRLFGTYGRLPVQALKIATILAALEWQTGDAPKIKLPHWARAVGVAETWRASAHRALQLTKHNGFEQLRQKLKAVMVRFMPVGPTLRDLQRATGESPKKLLDTLEEMKLLGEIISVDQNSTSKGGRPTVRYQAVF